MRRIALGSVAVLIAAGLGACSGGSSSDQGSDAGDTGGDTSLPCDYEVRENVGLAYRYGVPSGWLASEGAGGLTIAPDATGTSAALVYTALLNDDREPTWFLDTYMEAFASLFGSQASAVTSSGASEISDGASTSFTATVGGVPVSGTASAGVENRFATVKVRWSPTDGSGADDATLVKVLDCFSRATTPDDDQLSESTSAADQPDGDAESPWGALVPRAEGNFSFSAPESWGAETAEPGTMSFLGLTAPDDDAAVLFMFMSDRNQPSDSALIGNIFGSFGIQAPLQTSTFVVPNARVYDFEGTIQGRPARGMVALRVDTYVTAYVSYLSLVISVPEKWESYSPTLVRIAASAGKTDVSGNLASMPALPDLSMGDTIVGLAESAAYRDAVREKASDAWSEAMLGYVTVESPSTGQRWRTSVNSYNPTYGGYVRQLPGGGTELLDQK